MARHRETCTDDQCQQCYPTMDNPFIPFERKHKPCDAPGCTGIAYGARYCGAYVCGECGKHVGLARCFCGWAADGGDGRAQLIDMGETIGDEEW